MKALIASLLIGLSAMVSSAQTTSLTATITDSQSTAWANAPYTVTFVGSQPGKPYTTSGQVFTQSYSGTADGSGAFSISAVNDVNFIVPKNSTWQVCVTPAISSARTYCTNVPIQGSSQDISSQIAAVIVAPNVTGGLLASAYVDAEVKATPGNMYYRISDNSFRCYATSWAACGGGGASLSLTTTGSTGSATLIGNTLNIPVYQGALTVTTTGSSGAATLVGNTLNVPQYAAGTCSNALTMNNSGSGAASGSTFTCGSAVTLSYNTLGALPTTGGTLTGKLIVPASSSSGAGFNLGNPGSAPTSPVKGDLWLTNAGLFVRTALTAVTQGPFLYPNGTAGVLYSSGNVATTQAMLVDGQGGTGNKVAGSDGTFLTSVAGTPVCTSTTKGLTTTGCPQPISTTTTPVVSDGCSINGSSPSLGFFFQCENFAYWWNQTTGTITWVVQTGPIYFNSCNAKWAVDSVNGSDSNTGACGSPFQTLTHLQGVMSANDSVSLAANSHWRGDFTPPGGNTISAYGYGTRPELDANIVISSFTLNLGDSFTYFFTYTPSDNPTTVLQVYENGVPLAFQTSIANVESNPGTYYDPSFNTGTGASTCTSNCTVYIHPTGSTNPNSDGNLYEAPSYSGPYNCTGTGGSACGGTAGENVSGIWVRGSDGHFAFTAPAVSTVHDVLMTDGNFHTAWINYNTSFRNVVISGAYYPVVACSIGCPAPIVWNWQPPASSFLNFSGLIVQMPATLITGNGTCTAFTGHNGTNPTPLTGQVTNSKFINCAPGGIGLAGTIYAVGVDEWWDQSQWTTGNGGFGGDSTYTTNLNISNYNGNFVLPTGIASGSTVNISNSLYYTPSWVYGAPTTYGINWQIGTPATFNLTNSSIMGVQILSNSGTITNFTSKGNQIGYGPFFVEYSFSNLPTNFTSDFNTFPNASGGDNATPPMSFNVAGTTYSWPPAPNSLTTHPWPYDTHTFPQFTFSSGWGGVVTSSVAGLEGWTMNSGDTFGQFAFVENDDTRTANPTVTHTWLVPYKLAPFVTLSCVGLETNWLPPTPTTTGVTFTLNGTPAGTYPTLTTCTYQVTPVTVN